jgi:subtilisin family serine protease
MSASSTRRRKRRCQQRFGQRNRKFEQLERRILLTVNSMFPSAVQFEIDPTHYEPDSLIVRYLDGHSTLSASASSSPHAFAARSEGLGQAGESSRHLYKIKLPENVTMGQALASYRDDPNVLYAEPNYYVHVTATPDDSRFDEMWGLENTGQTGGTEDADIDMSQAWDVTTGSSEVVVAVIDTGIDYNHPDLAQNIWVNGNEIPNDGIDNDNNGYVDDVVGYDFINGDPDPMDDQGHGTHVAGTIGAAGNNGVGVSGINWDVQLMGLKFLGADGSGTTADAIEAIYYALDNGADVINASWGGDPYSQALYDAIAATADANQIFVAAAGNGDIFGFGIDNDAAPFYPSGYDVENIIAVAATDHNDALATFSNYGATTVDLAAPGVNILSTTMGSGYGTNSGTSMAAPHVAGVAAMVQGLHPSWIATQVIEKILSTAEPLPGLQGVLATGGRLNAAAAVDNPEPPPPPPPPVDLPVVENFDDGVADGFVSQSGSWTVGSGRFNTSPPTDNDDFVAVTTLNLNEQLPVNFEIRAVLKADVGRVDLFGIVLSDHLENGWIIYDYVGPEEFRFAGADIDGDRWVVGHRSGDDWVIDAQLGETLQPNVNYDVRLIIENETDVTLEVSGVPKLSLQHSEVVTSGAIGLGAKDSSTHFDDVLVQQYAPPVALSLPIAEDFNDEMAQGFQGQQGVWYVESGRYRAIPSADQDGLSTIQLADPLPANVEIQATINVDDVTTGRYSNAFVIFDYDGPTDFKFAGAYAGEDRWLVGHRTSSGWIEDATFQETIDAAVDYEMTVLLQDDTVTLSVGGENRITHSFADSIVDGEIGLATRDALSYFDNIVVQEYVPPPPPPATTLPTSEDFDDGVADHFLPQFGIWTVAEGRYRVVPTLDEDGISTLHLAEGLPSSVEIRATINVDDVTKERYSNGFVIYDYQGPTDFKFAGAYAGDDQWLIGHRDDVGWNSDAVVSQAIAAGTDYSLTVLIEGDSVTLSVDGVLIVSHAFADSLVDGAIGVGTRDALSYFDDFAAQEYVPPPPPPATDLPVQEDFDDGLADFFIAQSGSWTVDGDRYRVVPTPDQDGISTIHVAENLPSNVEVHVTINVDDVTTGRYSNGFVIYDYHGPTDFKFAGAYAGDDQWLIGHRNDVGWVSDAVFSQSIEAETDYDLKVLIEGESVTLSVDGVQKAAYTFADSPTDGAIGVGTRDALSYFDNMAVQEFVPPPPPPATDLPVDENFDDGLANFFFPRSGSWTVEDMRYRVVPTLDKDGVSTLNLLDALPENVEIFATINADDVSTDRLSNSFVIFDYQSPTDFKFAGAYAGVNRWLMGRRTSSGWMEDATLNEIINAGTDYSMRLRLEGDKATFTVDGEAKIAHTFSESIVDGDLGLGTRNALSYFDDVFVQEYFPPPPPPSTTLPVNEDFDDGAADFFAPQLGDWHVDVDRYRAEPLSNQDAVSILQVSEELPTQLEIQATINADAVTPGRLSNSFIIFDYQGPTEFKFAGAYVGANRWLMGHRTSTGWVEDATFREIIAAGTDHALTVRLDGNAVTMLVSGEVKITHTFADLPSDGGIGLGTRDAFSYFDDFQVREDATSSSITATAIGSISTGLAWPDSIADASNDALAEFSPLENDDVSDLHGSKRFGDRGSFGYVGRKFIGWKICGCHSVGPAHGPIG